jgi:hypothetical protein
MPIADSCTQQTIFTSCNDYSITPSARASSVVGTSMPSAVAVGVDAGTIPRGLSPTIKLHESPTGVTRISPTMW